MIGLLAFEDNKVDFAIMECHIGGRLCPTNIIEKVHATAITSIAFDYCELLGSNLESIAFEKAGIIKQGVPCVIGPTVT
jgi:dihydrofolate synthase/folylpolyglutamate synthase